MMTGAADRYLDQVKDIVFRHLHGRNVTVYLFGSRVGDAAHRFSDVDVAIDPREPLSLDALATLQEALEESTVPWRVDIVDLSHVDADFRQRVIREGVRMDRLHEQLEGGAKVFDGDGKP